MKWQTQLPGGPPSSRQSRSPERGVTSPSTALPCPSFPSRRGSLHPPAPRAAGSPGLAWPVLPTPQGPAGCQMACKPAATRSLPQPPAAGTGRAGSLPAGWPGHQHPASAAATMGPSQGVHCKGEGRWVLAAAAGRTGGRTCGGRGHWVVWEPVLGGRSQQSCFPLQGGLHPTEPGLPPLTLQPPPHYRRDTHPLPKPPRPDAPAEHSSPQRTSSETSFTLDRVPLPGQGGEQNSERRRGRQSAGPAGAAKDGGATLFCRPRPRPPFSGSFFFFGA